MIMIVTTGWAPRSINVQLPYKWQNSMLYGRYNELVNGVYKPTHNWGGTIITRG